MRASKLDAWGSGLIYDIYNLFGQLFTIRCCTYIFLISHYFLDIYECAITIHVFFGLILLVDID